jgi:hypothetical protein
MDVVSASPLRTASIVWQPQPRAFVLTVVCKATYLLQPIESPLAPEPDEPNLADVYRGDSAASGLRVAGDLAPFKRRIDVLLTGHAFAPGGQPTRAMTARLALPGVSKAIEIFGDSAWTRDGERREGPLFTAMPLRWDRAAGGPETANPAGILVGRDASPDAEGWFAIPNLRPLGAGIAGPFDAVAPIGFGPIAPEWSGRASKLFWHAMGWDHRACLSRPLPEDIDAGYFNAAPADQQIDDLAPDVRLVLDGLHREHPVLVTSLARVVPSAVIERDGGRAEIALRCDTLAIDTDRARCTLTWRGQVPLRHPAEAGRVIVTVSTPVVKARRPLLGTGTLGPGFVVAGSPLPFAAEAAPPAPARVVFAAPPPSDLESPGWRPAAPAPLPAIEIPAVAPPPMIGPLATAEPAPESVGAADTLAPPPPEVPIEEPLPRPAPELDQGRYPVDRGAAIAASLARRPAEEKEILENNDLDDGSWKQLSRSFREAIAEETGRGRTALLDRWDASYVAQLEQERGPIKPEEYARIVVAQERGSADAALAELSLPTTALMPVTRVWIGKIAADLAFAVTVNAAVEDAREA